MKPGTEAVRPPRRALGEWPLVGRAEELRLAWEQLDRAGRPPAGVVIAGAAGVGKTRLARTLTDRASKAGWACIEAAGSHAAAGIAFGAIAHLLPSPSKLRPLPPIDVLTRAAGELEQLAAGRRLLLALDDAHLLDDGSATLTRQLACGGVVVLVLTVRSGEPTPDSIRALWKDESIPRIELQPLSRAQVYQLLGHVLDGTTDAPTRQLLWRASIGNVFLLRELVLGGISTGRLVETDDVWHWEGELAPAPGLAEVLSDRIAGLPSAERETLELVAVGEPLPISVVEALGCTRTAASLERLGMLTEEQGREGGALRLSHPLYGDVLRASIPPMALRDYRRAITSAMLESGPLSPDGTLRVATWKLDAIERAPAKLLLGAARRAAELPDHMLAERLSRAAHDARPEAESRLLLVQSLRSQARWQEAIDLCSDWAGLSSKRPAESARFALEHAHALFFGLHDPVGAMRLLDAALETAQGDLRDSCLSLQAVIALFGGDLDAAERSARRIAARADTLPEIRARALLCLVAVLAVKGDTAEAVHRAEAVQAELTGRPGVPAIWRAQLLFSMAVALRFHGRVDDALTRTRHYYDESSGKDLGAAAFAALSLGQSLLFAGSVYTAAGVMREARALLRRADTAGLLPLSVAGAAHASALAQEPALSERLFQEANELAYRLPPVFRPQLDVHLAWVVAIRGEHSRARQLITQAAQQAAATGQHAVHAAALHDIVRLGDPAKALPGLIDVQPRLSSPLAKAWLGHARAAVAGDGSALDEVAAVFAGCGVHLLAAEAARQATYYHARGGHLAPAYGSRLFADREAALCETARTPLLEHAGDPAQLTRREREICWLAAAGQSNRQIAARLGVSVRTVEGHLLQTYAKLGIRSRAQLPNAGPHESASSGRDGLPR